MTKLDEEVVSFSVVLLVNHSTAVCEFPSVFFFAIPLGQQTVPEFPEFPSQGNSLTRLFPRRVAPSALSRTLEPRLVECGRVTLELRSRVGRD